MVRYPTHGPPQILLAAADRRERQRNIHGGRCTRQGEMTEHPPRQVYLGDDGTSTGAGVLDSGRDDRTSTGSGVLGSSMLYSMPWFVAKNLRNRGIWILPQQEYVGLPSLRLAWQASGVSVICALLLVGR